MGSKFNGICEYFFEKCYVVPCYVDIYEIIEQLSIRFLTDIIGKIRWII